MPFDNQHYKDPVKWVNGGFSGSEDALVGGHDVGGETLYIGRAGKFGNLIPGKVVPSHKACYVAHEGREDRYIIYEVLVATPECDVGWEYAYQGCLPRGAVQGGYTDKKEPLFIGRAHYDGSLTVGKVNPHQGICQISFGGNEIGCREFEVLVARAYPLNL